MSVKVRKLYGDTWGVVIHHQGRRWKQSVGSKKAADLYADELRLEVARGRVGLPRECPTFSVFAKEWLLFVELRRSPRTVQRYRGLIEKATRHIGDKPVDAITRGDLRDLLLKEYKSGAAKGSVELLHSVLSGVFHHAIEDGLIQVAPTVRLMRRLDLDHDKDEIRPLSTDEMDAAIEAVDQYYRPFFLFLFETGCRIGEATAITWGDIDIRNKKISINKTAKDQLVKRSTKTKAKRTIDMSDTMCAALMRLREECGQDHLSGPVFSKDGRLYSDNTIRRKWDAACNAIGIGHRRLHDIRHTTASLLLARNVPVTYVSEMLGHSSAKMTLDTYAHYIPQESEGLINKLRAGN